MPVISPPINILNNMFLDKEIRDVYTDEYKQIET